MVAKLRESYPLGEILSVAGLARATYFYWRKHLKDSNKDKALEAAMVAIRQENPNYGYRPMTQMLRKSGYLVNKKKVQRLMRKLHLGVTSFWRKSRKYNSYKGTVGKVAKNILDRKFLPEEPFKKLTTDTSEFKYYEGKRVKKLYLNPFMDLYSGEIISYGLSQQPTAEPVLTACEEALQRTKSVKERLFHSDQGWVYQMPAYVHQLEVNHVTQSMSRKGNCHDNSPMENFFGLLKQEIYYGRVYHSYCELYEAITRYIDYYNTKRIKQRLGWLSPVAYRLAYQK